MEVYPIFLPLAGCPYRCIYCDQYAITGETEYSIDKHLDEISDFCKFNKTSYKEIAFFGGTFTAFSIAWQEEQFSKLKPFINDLTKIRYSTRPDCLDQEDIDLGKKYGLQTIELGIQDFTDEVLLKTRRGYDSNTAIEACKLVSDNSLDLGIQIMPGLPAYSETTLKETITQVIRLKPKYVRIYPTVVLKNTKLETLYNNGDYSPLSLEDAIKICAETSQEFEKQDIKVIKVGVQVDSHFKENIIAGPYHPAFGELVKSYIFVKKIVNALANGLNDHLYISKYDTSLLLGHGGYGKKLLQQSINSEYIKLNIDNNLEKGYFKV